MANEPGEGRSPEEDENEGGPVKSFLEHLEDLRWTLIKSASAIAVGVLICLLAGNYVVAILMRPLEKAVIKYPGTNQVVTLSFGTNRLGTFNLDSTHEELFNLDPNGRSPLFSTEDIINLKSLATKLKNPTARKSWGPFAWGPLRKDNVSEYIRGQLSPETLNLLSQYNGGTNSQLQNDLVVDLDRIIQSGPIYDTNRFARVRLSKETAKLLAQNPQGQELVWLNRMLLLEAYPREILKDRNRFLAFEIVPVTITSGSNQIRVLAFQPNTNVNAAAQAMHMNTSLMALGPAKAFLVGFRVALYAGIALASPFIFFFVGEFVLPALKITERKYLYRGLGFAIPLFLCGVFFCYFILMPAALAASQMYADWFGFSSNLWDAGDYIGFVCKFMLGMGVGFELPVVILVLVKIGLLNYRILKKARPYMIVINLILGAVLTTPEVFTQVLMAIPLQLLFELSLLIVWYWERQERKRVEAEGGEVIDAD